MKQARLAVDWRDTQQVLYWIKAGLPTPVTPPVDAAKTRNSGVQENGA